MFTWLFCVGTMLVAVTHTWAYPCGRPPVCACYRDMRMIQCAGKDLKEVPTFDSNIRKWAKILDLRNNHITSLSTMPLEVKTWYIHVEGNIINCTSLDPTLERALLGLTCLTMAHTQSPVRPNTTDITPDILTTEPGNADIYEAGIYRYIYIGLGTLGLLILAAIFSLSLCLIKKVGGYPF